MTDTYISRRNLDFLLYEVLDTESITKRDFFAEHDRATFDLVLDTAFKICDDLIFPVFTEMDRKQPEYDGGVVKVHPVVRTLSRQMGEGGWIGAHAEFEHGGQQMPGTVMAAFRAVFAAANYSAAVYPFLTSGAAHLILSFGSKELIDTYIERMFSGAWQGTMALTEPNAGSSLTDVATTARPTGDGHYLMSGQKIFISCAEHDGTDNVVNLMLARVEGAPAGVKGISLFVVPKLRPEGDELVPNDIVCTTIYHKLGYKGAPITQLSLGEAGECRGYLVGEEHKGLKYMFQMMNEARIDVGMSAAAIAGAAYYAALEYTRERTQGRLITEKDPTKPQMPIIGHADVKRMLLFQRAVVEGSLALNLQCAKYIDLIHTSEGEEKENCELLLDILTPIAKTYPSEMGVQATSAGLQCLGGYGYCDEFPLEEYYRDARIHPIHEGTTGIQGMDLLGRKVVMKNGKAAMLFIQAVNDAGARAREVEGLGEYADALSAAVGKLTEVTTHLTSIAMKGEVELFLADATLFLEQFGIITIAWQWLEQAMVAARALEGATGEEENFYRGKLQTCRYFFGYELPKCDGLARRLLAVDDTTIAMRDEWFTD